MFFALSISLPAFAAGKCADWTKLAAIDWAKEVLESDLETTKQLGAEPLSIEMKSPILQDKSKNPASVFEVYSINWKLNFKDKNWDYTGFYFYDESCHRMRSAEYKAGKEAERKSAEKKNKK